MFILKDLLKTMRRPSVNDNLIVTGNWAIQQSNQNIKF